MYKEYDNKLVITVNDWVAAGLTKNMLWKDSSNGDLVIAHRALYGNALIDVRSIKRFDRISAIETAYGKIDAQSKIIKFFEILPDQSALDFFTAYRYGVDEDQSLPSDSNNNVILQYCNEAAILNMVQRVFKAQTEARAKTTKKIRRGDFWKDASAFCQLVDTQKRFSNELPKNAQAFERKFKDYLNRGYIAIISKKYGNSNTQKITPQGAEWLVARYASMIDRVTMQQLYIAYNIKAKEMAWKPLKTENTLRKFMHKPEIEILWYGARYGELKAKEKYASQHRTHLSSMRDSLWYGDGTKLNFFYLDENGKRTTCSVYEVIDEYSEVLLGYHISKTEDFEQQYRAYRMALEFSGYKPYQIKYDNQGGHKKLTSTGFFTKMSHLCIPTQPYNGQSKTIESVFGRFQSQILQKDWFFTGQNITAVKQESKVNKEFVAANPGNLLTFSEMVSVYEKRRNEWNHAEHPKTGRPRIEMYYSSSNPDTKKIGIMERITLFGMLTQKPSEYKAAGIEITVKNEKYAYEVLTSEGEIDYDFRNKHTGRKFFVEYDLEDMRIVNLYESTASGLKFVTMAQKYIVVQRNIQEQDELDVALLQARDRGNKEFRMDLQNKVEDLLEKHGMHPWQHGLNMPKPAGLKSTSRFAKTSRQKARKVLAQEVGAWEKEESNLCLIDEDARKDY